MSASFLLEQGGNPRIDALHQPARRLVNAQVASLGDLGGLNYTPSYHFDPSIAQRAQLASEGQRVIAVTAGGSNLVRAGYIVEKGVLRLVEPQHTLLKSTNGTGYLEEILIVGEEAKSRDAIVGMAIAAAAGPNAKAQTGMMLEEANLGVLKSEIDTRYGGDLGVAVPRLRVLRTDTVFNLVAGMMHAREQEPGVVHGVGVTIGTGTGLAVAKDGLYSTLSAEYVLADPSLIPTGMEGTLNLEEITAGPGLTEMYEMIQGEAVTGEELSRRAMHGDEIAGELYANSAHAAAHMLPGVEIALGLFNTPRNTAVVLDGSLLERDKVPGYANLLLATAQANVGNEFVVVRPEAFTVLPALEGAAIAAVTEAYVAI